MTKRLIQLGVILVLVLLPFAIRWYYLESRALPDEIVIATGAPHGRYHAIGEAMAERIERKLGVSVRLLPTRGSLDNLRLLRRGEVDFILYQPGTLELLDTHDRIVDGQGDQPAKLTRSEESTASPEFVSNLYSQPAHFVVRAGSEIASPGDLKGRRVSLGLPNSGDLAMSMVLLDHFELDPSSDFEAIYDLDYTGVVQAFEEGTLDAAFLTVGVQADVLRELASVEACRFQSILNVDALTRSNLYVDPYTIPHGLYGFEPAVPRQDVNTVSAAAQLLTRRETPKRLVHEVTRLVHDKEFLKHNHLWELYSVGYPFALTRPEFPVHPGAGAYYDPELRPLLDPGFVESTEGLFSFGCSIMIALFVLFRWIRKERASRREHKLDRYIRDLLDIERQQMHLDERDDRDDVDALRELLDRVTMLRQEALNEFTTHQLSEDQGTDCFVQMCHALSNKINSKLTRQQQKRLLEEFVQAIKPDAEAS